MMKVPIILRENLVSQIYNYNSNIRLDMIDDNKYIILPELFMNSDLMFIFVNFALRFEFFTFYIKALLIFWCEYQ